MISPGGSSISTVLRMPPRLGLAPCASARRASPAARTVRTARVRTATRSERVDMEVSGGMSSGLVHHEAAGHVDGLAGHVGRLAGGEEADHVGDVLRGLDAAERDLRHPLLEVLTGLQPEELLARLAVDQDRKSTRLNSSHVEISYAV